MVYTLTNVYFINPCNLMENSLSHIMSYTPGIFDNICGWQYFLERDISMISCGHNHIIIKHMLAEVVNKKTRNTAMWR